MTSPYKKRFKNRFGRKAGKYLRFAIQADQEIIKDFTTTIRQLRVNWLDLNTPIYSHLCFRSHLMNWKNRNHGFWTRYLHKKLKLNRKDI